MKKQNYGLKELRRIFFTGFKIAFSLNVFITIAIVVFGDYFNLLKSIDLGILCFFVVSILLYTLMVVGILPGYYSRDYRDFIELILLISIGIWSALPRNIIYFWIYVDDYLHGDTRYAVVTARNELSSLLRFDPVLVIVFLACMVSFYFVFFGSKGVAFSEVHWLAGVIRGNKEVTRKPIGSFANVKTNGSPVRKDSHSPQVMSPTAVNKPAVFKNIKEVIKKPVTVEETNDMDGILLRRTSR